jgi:hypothetical protein
LVVEISDQRCSACRRIMCFPFILIVRYNNKLTQFWTFKLCHVEVSTNYFYTQNSELIAF